MSYDTAITVFSPDGHLFQVEYAQEAVKKGSTAVGIRGDDVVVLGVERKTIAKLQENWSVRKISLLDNHIAFTFAGLTADARILVNRARVECQSHRLSVEDPVRVEYITKHVSSIQQIYTQGSGRRPFGLATLITGFDLDGTPHLFQTDPSGTYNEWKANVIGRNAKSVREFLEKHYNSKIASSSRECIKLCIRTLLEVVQNQAKNVEVLVLYRNMPAVTLSDDEVQVFIDEIDKEKAESAAEQKTTDK